MASWSNLRHLRLEADPHPVIRAEAQDDEGSWHDTELDFHDLVVNRHGKLVWRHPQDIDGDQVRNLSLSQASLTAETETKIPDCESTWKYETIDLSERISVCKGSLSYNPPNTLSSYRISRTSMNGPVLSGTTYDGAGRQCAFTWHMEHDEKLSVECIVVATGNICYVPKDRETPIFGLGLVLTEEPFMYHALSTPEHIRLLKVERVSQTQATGLFIQCSLVDMDLRSDPAYCALSYVWSDPGLQTRGRSYMEAGDFLTQKGPGPLPQDFAHAVPIICNGRQISVKQNLFDFLISLVEDESATLQAGESKQVCLPWEYYWIDAICINQQDKLEKATQVQLMGNIYRKAGLVHVWLGREDFYTVNVATSAAAVETACQAQGVDIVNHSLASQVCQPLLSDGLHAGTKAQQRDLHADSPYAAIASLFARSWFTRAWVIQETVLARTITVSCGSYHLSWDALIIMAQMMSSKRSAEQLCAESFPEQVRSEWGLTAALSKFFPMQQIEDWRQQVLRGGSTHVASASRVLTFLRNYNATDPRIKAYAAASFTSAYDSQGGTSLMWLRADYNKDLRVLLIEISLFLLEQFGPGMLSLKAPNVIDATLKTPEAAVTTPKLPSWVPDIRQHMTHTPLGLTINSHDDTLSLSASSANKANQARLWRVVGDRLILSSCRTLGTIKQTTSIDLAPSGNPWQLLVGILNIAKTASGTKGEQMDALWRTLIANKSRDKEPVGDLRKLFSDGWR